MRWIRALRADAAERAGRRGAFVALIVLIGLVAAGVLAPLLVSVAPDALDLAHRRAAPSMAHWFGTDVLGRDVLARVLYGARVSLPVGILSAAVSGALGIAMGGVSGYAGGAVDAVLMRITDAMLAVPRLPLLMIAAVIVQPTVGGLIVLVGATGWMETARVVRAEFLSLRTRDFFEAARASGAARARIVLRHLLPNAAPAAAVSITLAVGRGILIESTLSFFGVGVQPPTASWGNMLYQAQGTMTTEPWLAVFPGASIFVTVLCVSIVGDGLGERGQSARSLPTTPGPA
jgi:peptide/nickel transport system permease protein